MDYNDIVQLTDNCFQLYVLHGDDAVKTSINSLLLTAVADCMDRGLSRRAVTLSVGIIRNRMNQLLAEFYPGFEINWRGMFEENTVFLLEQHRSLGSRPFDRRLVHSRALLELARRHRRTPFLIPIAGASSSRTGQHA
ncbi:unnamed protein product [Caenorhabditis bovis]|uniref:Uncharacterized protein n=1 Tax=Caenorhabditis bovis TaxID=2654633 RepID=A0A8S1EV48_9PELO|nr:unnamed protein product [Caenorhabditis bovis]